MKQRRYRRLIVRGVVVMICGFSCVRPAPAQEVTSDWVQQIMRLHRTDQVASSWRTQLKRLEKLILKGKFERALTEGTQLAAEMVSMSSSDKVGEVLGIVNMLRAIAAYHVGDERQALWLWQTSLQLIPELSRYDLTRFGEGVDLLYRHPPGTDDDGQRERATALQADETLKDRVTAPVKKHVPPPTFPPAKPETKPLEVVISVIIDTLGRPTSPRIVQADGDVPLVFASLEALGTWQFEPATRGGEPTEFVTNLTVRYRTRE